MGGNLPRLLAMLLLSLLLPPPPCSSAAPSSSSELSRADFPPDFVFGAGTSAYQVEGAVDEDGRGVSIWDTFTHAGRAVDRSTADVTADGYHHYREDVKRMSEIGLESYRFSISWPRIVPNGRGAINPKGIEFYNKLINELVNHGIQPHVTLYHFDLPQVLEDEYMGWLSPKIIDDFVAYANICFKEFGDRVSHWTTINEPNILAISAYDQGIVPPGRCSSPFGSVSCTAGNSTTEPYIAVHNFLLAHASVAELYKTKYKAIQKGFVGINLYAFTFYPKTNLTADLEASQRAYDFFLGWALNPLLFGDYPEIIKATARSKIPSFSEGQSKLLRGSIDFLGINYYASLYVSNKPDTYETGAQDFLGDIRALLSDSKNSTGGQLSPTSLSSEPDGLKNILLFMKTNYGDLPIYIHESGFGTPYNVTINDTGRIDLMDTSIRGVLSAIRSGSNCKGYFVWSFLDVFETLLGFMYRYGLYYVDFEDENRRREPKLSALWYKDFLKKPKDLTSF